MRGRLRPHSSETADILRALRRAARNALELGLKTGTPVYVIKDNKIVDLTKDQTNTSRAKAKSRKAKPRISRVNTD